MSDASELSQREIDALLQESDTNPDEADTTQARVTGPPRALPKVVRSYDFRRPDKFSKEQLRSLRALHEGFARLSASLLSNQLRTNVDVHVASIEQGLYEEYVNQVPTPAFVNVIRMHPHETSILLTFEHDVGTLFIDLLLGGLGVREEAAHEVSDIDRRLLRAVGEIHAGAVGEAWEGLATVEPTVIDIHNDLQGAAFAPPSEVVVLVFFEVALLGVSGSMSICTPFKVLEPFMSRLSTSAWVQSSPSTDDSTVARIEEHLQRTPTTLSVQLGAARAPAEELADLHVGDVIRLEQRRTRAVPVFVDQIQLGVGRPGIIDGRVGIKIEVWPSEDLHAASAKDLLFSTSAAPAASQGSPVHD